MPCTRGAQKIATRKKPVACKRQVDMRKTVTKTVVTKKRQAQKLCDRRQRERKKHERNVEEFMHIIRDLSYDNSVHDKAKVMREVFIDACDYFDDHYPLIKIDSAKGAAICHRKRCELARVRMKEFYAEKARST